MEQINIPEYIVCLGELLVVFLGVHLPVLIIIGGLLILIDIYHRRFYEDDLIKGEFSKQCDIVRGEQNKVEALFLKCAFIFSFFIPIIVIIIDALCSNEPHKFVICSSYIVLLLILYVKTRKLRKKLIVLSGSREHMREYVEKYKNFDDDIENPFDYYNT